MATDRNISIDMASKSIIMNNGTINYTTWAVHYKQ